MSYFDADTRVRAPRGSFVPSPVFLAIVGIFALAGVLAWFDYAAQKTMPVPEHVRAWIRAREAVAPEE